MTITNPIPRMYSALAAALLCAACLLTTCEPLPAAEPAAEAAVEEAPLPTPAPIELIDNVSRNDMVDKILLKLLEQEKTAKVFAILFMVMGACRLALKPVFSIMWGIVRATPTRKDDDFLAKVESSKALKVFVYLLDYVFSFKAAHPKAQAI